MEDPYFEKLKVAVLRHYFEQNTPINPLTIYEADVRIKALAHSSRDAHDTAMHWQKKGFLDLCPNYKLVINEDGKKYISDLFGITHYEILSKELFMKLFDELMLDNVDIRSFLYKSDRKDIDWNKVIAQFEYKNFGNRVGQYSILKLSAHGRTVGKTKAWESFHSPNETQIFTDNSDRRQTTFNTGDISAPVIAGDISILNQPPKEVKEDYNPFSKANLWKILKWAGAIIGAFVLTYFLTRGSKFLEKKGDNNPSDSTYNTSHKP